MKKYKKILIRTLCVTVGLMALFVNVRPLLVSANPTVNSDHVYLSDLKWESAVSGWKDQRALKVDQNEPGKLISLLVEGKQKFFLHGVFAHATSTVIYDISEYTKKGFDTFAAYIGVDTYASSNGNGVKFEISVSNDKSNWTELKTTGIMKGDTNAEKISLTISNYKYLKLYAYDCGNQSSDHSVYADAIIYNSSTYSPRLDATVDFVKDVSVYDAELKNHSATDILKDSNLELKLLQRTLVSRVGYQILQAYATDSQENEETLKWLFNDKNVLKKYITGGEPLGNYISSFNVLSKLYHTYKADLSSEHKDVFLTMMLAISLTHSNTVALWVSGENGEPVTSDPVARYAAFKKLYTKTGLPDNYQPTFDIQTFEALTVEEMRWVVDSRLSDEEIPWLNWYSSRIQKEGETTKYDGRNQDHTPRNPYTYIQYADGWSYHDKEYYKEGTTYCGMNYLNKNQTGYSRGLSCEQEYQLSKWGVGTTSTAKPRLWIIWEEDGVCGAISKTGENLEGSYGNPSAVTRQPGHAAYLVMSKKKNEDGTFTTKWSIGNDVSGWAKSSGTEKGERLPLNWGTTTNDYASYYNGSYVILAQRAIDHFSDYEKALEYKLIADIYENDLAKQRELYRAIVGTQDANNNKAINTGGIQYYNFDGWYGLVQTYLKDGNMTSHDYYKLAYEIMANFKEFPLAMHDLLNLIEKKITDSRESMLETSAYQNVLKELSTTPNDSTVYLQGQAVRQVAQYLLGLEEEQPISFSFDGANANKIVLSTAQPFEYSLNYSYNTESQKVSGDWTTVSTGTSIDLTSQLHQINSTNDIVVHILGDQDKAPNSDSITIIDIQENQIPSGLYANELENKLIGWSDTMEWTLTDPNTTTGWTKFKDALPDLSGLKTVFVRDGAHGNILASDYVEFTFEADPALDPTKVYIPNSRLSATASSRQNNGEHENKALDGNANTMWHTYWDGSDKELWINIKIEGGAKLSKIEYMPRQDNSSNGRITKALIQTSIDGENWTTVGNDVIWANDKSTKTFILETPTQANYVKIKALETADGTNYASAAMFNLYENKVPDTISVNDLSVSYMTSGFVYNGEEKKPIVTVKYQEKELILGEDYTIAYQNNINAGTAKIILTGLDIYDGTRELEFTIAKASSLEITPEKHMVATAQAKTVSDLVLPTNWVWEVPSTLLVSGKTITAKAIYNGSDKNNYENTEVVISITQEIGSHPVVKGNNEVEYDLANETTININDILTGITISDKEDGKIDITDIQKVKVTYDWEGDFPTHVGTYHIYILVTDSHGNQTDFTIQIILKDSQASQVDINDHFHIDIEADHLEYTGNAQTPNIVIKDSYGHILTKEVDYTLEFSNHIYAGIATVNIKGIGLYTGSKTLQFTILKASKPTIQPDATIAVSEATTTLADIHLPDGWQWIDENIELVEGENHIKLVFLGDENHERYETEIIVVKEIPIIPEQPEEPEEPPVSDTPEESSTPNPPQPSQDNSYVQSNSQSSTSNIDDDHSLIEESESKQIEEQPVNKEENKQPDQQATEIKKEHKIKWYYIVTPFAIISLMVGFIINRKNHI